MKQEFHIRLGWLGLALCSLLVGFAGRTAHAEDIDIYQGSAGGAAPNLLIIFDNSGATNANASYTCDATLPGGATKLSEDKKTAGTNFGLQRCGLYKAIRAIGADPALSGNINLGLMYFPKGGTDGGVFVEPPPTPAPGALLTMDGTGVGSGGLSKMLGTISGLSLSKDNGNSNQITQSMQEAWAFYHGKKGMSGTNYPGLGSFTCAKNFVLYITFATNNQKAQDNGDKGRKALETAQIKSPIPDLKLPTWKSPVSNALPKQNESNAADEWAAFMRSGQTTNSSISYSPITTYTIILSDGTNPDYEQLMVSMAQYGGGMAFLIDSTKANNMEELVKAIKRVFSDVQAVNSVFAAPVLPVSANTQGTYLNQIYMGMFRPDATGAPRWMGNLKQYRLGVDTTSGSVELFTADASWGPYSPGKNAREALSTAGTGFVSTQAISYWTSKDTSKLPDDAATSGGFWLNSYTDQGASDGFDSPDGQFVEKGGVGQQLRLQFLQQTYPATTVDTTATTSRNVYTCPTAGCSEGDPLSKTLFDIKNTTTLTTTALNVVTAWVNNLINWFRGQDTRRLVSSDNAAGPEGNVPPTATTPISIRGSIHGDVLHSRPVVINYGNRADATGKKFGTVVFYGSNDGMFRAINGNQPPLGTDTSKPMGECTVSSDCAISIKDAKNATISVPPGGELWSFVAPEFFPCLRQLYTNSMQLTLGSTTANSESCNDPKNPSGKPYFFDGAPGYYWNPDTGEAYIYLTARRGGRLIYAIDVSDPANPRYMWKITNSTTGFEKLGQTWSQPKAVKIKGHSNPVLIFGGGYDTNQDRDAPVAGSDTMGNAIYVVDAVTGALVWRAQGGSGTNNSCTTTGTTCSLGGMSSSIPADITLIDRDFDGKADRLYAADTGGNIWRVDLQTDGTGDVSTWKAYLFASLGSSSSPPRKFFFPPDVVLTKDYDAVVAVTGDREHPLATSTANSVKNRFYMIKDTKIGLDGSGWTTVLDSTSATSVDGPSGLFNATCTDFNDVATCPSYDKSGSGFYITLPGSGEKGINAPTIFGGQVYFSTNRPDPVTNTSTGDTGEEICRSNLGVASGYSINVLAGVKTPPTEFDGGGLAPSPVAGFVTVDVNGKQETVPFIIGGGGGEKPCTSGLCAKRPTIPVPTTKRRTYWYPEVDR